MLKSNQMGWICLAAMTLGGCELSGGEGVIFGNFLSLAIALGVLGATMRLGKVSTMTTASGIVTDSGERR